MYYKNTCVVASLKLDDIKHCLLVSHPNSDLHLIRDHFNFSIDIFSHGRYRESNCGCSRCGDHHHC